MEPNATDRIVVPILAVLVLYKLELAESKSFTTLLDCLTRRPHLANGFSVLIYDNSPASHNPPETPFTTKYISNPMNPGLAEAYNTALDEARQTGAPWILLLDQDTVLTEVYLEELRSSATTLLDRSSVCGIVPKLIYAAGIHSPTSLPRLSHRSVDLSTFGLATQRLIAFNSGSFLRVSALEAIGGFPVGNRIEFLDHAVSHRLQRGGDRLWVMRATITHSLAASKLGTDLSLDRYKTILRAERLFYLGSEGPNTFAARFWYHLRRLKQALSHVLTVRDKRFALWDLRAALGFFDK